MAGETLDDRGRRVRVFPWETASGEEHQRVTDPLRQRLKHAESPYRFVLGIGCWVLLVVIGLAFGVPATWWTWLAAFCTLGLVTTIIRRTWAPRDITVGLRRELLKEAMCASCGYSIAEIEPEPDGCRVCPECGAAWRIGRAGRDGG